MAILFQFLAQSIRKRRSFTFWWNIWIVLITAAINVFNTYSAFYRITWAVVTLVRNKGKYLNNLEVKFKELLQRIQIISNQTFIWTGFVAEYLQWHCHFLPSKTPPFPLILLKNKGEGIIFFYLFLVSAGGWGYTTLILILPILMGMGSSNNWLINLKWFWISSNGI